MRAEVDARRNARADRGARRAIHGAALLLAAALDGVPCAAQSPHSHRHLFDAAGKWAQVFDDAERDAWQQPHQVIEALALRPDAVVAIFLVFGR